MSKPIALVSALARDDAHARVFCRVIREMLAAAEADLDPDLVDGGGEERGRIEPAAILGRRDAQARQQRGEAVLLRRAQALALAAAEEGAV